MSGFIIGVWLMLLRIDWKFSFVDRWVLVLVKLSLVRSSLLGKREVVGNRDIWLDLDEIDNF